jgi:hypothetical protein
MHVATAGRWRLCLVDWCVPATPLLGENVGSPATYGILTY